MNNKVKRVAAIHDLSGIGRCSLTAAIPILSVLGVQPAPFPTAILSCQTGFPEFSFLDLTNEMKLYKDNWKKLNFEFDGIYSGFLGSEYQIEIVKDFILDNKNSLVLIDPVMGDNGEIYKTYTKGMCEKVIDLVKLANIVTPNLTESCIITNRNYNDLNVTTENLLLIAKEISNLGPDKIVITGIIKDDYVLNFAYDKLTDNYFIAKSKYNKKGYSGTGDIFASIICGLLIKDVSFEKAVNTATEFIYNAIAYTNENSIDPRCGITFEPLLKDLLR